MTTILPRPTAQYTTEKTIAGNGLVYHTAAKVFQFITRCPITVPGAVALVCRQRRELCGYLVYVSCFGELYPHGTVRLAAGAQSEDCVQGPGHAICKMISDILGTEQARAWRHEASVESSADRQRIQ